MARSRVALIVQIKNYSTTPPSFPILFRHPPSRRRDTFLHGGNKIALRLFSPRRGSSLPRLFLREKKNGRKDREKKLVEKWWKWEVRKLRSRANTRRNCHVTPTLVTNPLFELIKSSCLPLWESFSVGSLGATCIYRFGPDLSTVLVVSNRKIIERMNFLTNKMTNLWSIASVSFFRYSGQLS